MKNEWNKRNARHKCVCSSNDTCFDGVDAFIGLGSNIGDSAANLQNATALLFATEENNIAGSIHNELHLCAVSSVYKTEPQDLRDQPFFCNQVLWVRCSAQVTPPMLLQYLFSVEEAMGRVRSVRFGPRIIDLDLLLFGNTSMDSELLVLPHPRMLDRAFVLVPLAEIAPDFLLPQGVTVKKALESLTYIEDDLLILQAEVG